MHSLSNFFFFIIPVSTHFSFQDFVIPVLNCSPSHWDRTLFCFCRASVCADRCDWMMNVSHECVCCCVSKCGFCIDLLITLWVCGIGCSLIRVKHGFKLSPQSAINTFFLCPDVSVLFFEFPWDEYALWEIRDPVKEAMRLK